MKMKDIKVIARVNKPPYFRDNRFIMPVEIQYRDDIRIPEDIRAFLNKDKAFKPENVLDNIMRTKNITFDCVLPVLLRTRIAYYHGLKGVEYPYTTRPVKKIEILDGVDVLASYESVRTDL
jgi:hypothetical protein